MLSTGYLSSYRLIRASSPQNSCQLMKNSPHSFILFARGAVVVCCRRDSKEVRKRSTNQFIRSSSFWLGHSTRNTSISLQTKPLRRLKITQNFILTFATAAGPLTGRIFMPGFFSESMARYRNRKGFIGQNVLAACNFAMLFVYILSGWEGSASDAAIFEYARERDFTVPHGKYYLADAGFPLCDALLTPFCGIRYHLKEWGTANQRPQNREELFNLRHAQARNIVERILGVAKRRFGVFSRAPEYPIEMQSMLIPAIGALHNFLRIHDRTDEAQDLGVHELQREGSSSFTDFIQDHAEPRQILPEELGMQINDAECTRASNRRDRIAQKMWEDYQAYIVQCGQAE
ncbi:putative nuclease HARBI1-like protein [Mycena venus]|uniref:Putative nuclease HARBI1-like protein n=1 Tax=Mycena venus TaxID=2733690 RepID=A0A8H6Y3X4_9AGAR|nr:putative nuclease HARBI1-like protein [Mycena venus]